MLRLPRAIGLRIELNNLLHLGDANECAGRDLRKVDSILHAFIGVEILGRTNCQPAAISYFPPTQLERFLAFHNRVRPGLMNRERFQIDSVVAVLHPRQVCLLPAQ